MSDQRELDLEAPGPNGDDAPGAPAEAWTLDGRSTGPLQRLIDGNFLQYASYVIRDRAIPDLDDGLKPVQRRILYSLHENDDGKFVKVANIAGYCMQYHPHGNVSIEDALVTLTNKRYLIEGQGNFGNLHTGDPAAASRYIECRLTDLARTQLFHEKLTPMVPSYDGRKQEPVTLPCKLPLLLLLGAEGIAVGLSTRVLPHNFCEVLQAQIAILEDKPFSLAPDFQQGGLMDASEYDKGRGRVRLRAVVEPHRKKNAVVIREIPFGTTTDSLISSIEDAARKKKVKIRSIDDFTAEQVEIEVQLAAGEDAEKTIQALYAFTNCELTVTVRPNVIHDGRPVEMDVESILRHNTKRLLKLLKQELQLEQKRLQDELHFKTLAQLFVEHRIYKRIEDCEAYADVQKTVLDGMNAYREHLRRDVTLPDVERLLALQIKRISRFDIHKNRKEIGDLMAELDRVESYLADLVAYAVGYVKALLKKYGKAYPRRTKILGLEQVERRELATDEYRLCWDRERGYLGHGVDGEEQFSCSSYDRILMVWDDGRYRVAAPPEKLFVDKNLIHVERFDRDQPFCVVFMHDQITYLKRFTFGGVILNKEYLCTLPGSRILMFERGEPDTLYVRYHRVKNQRVHEQMFRPKQSPLKGVKAKGNQLTVKRIRSVSTTRPRGWERN